MLSLKNTRIATKIGVVVVLLSLLAVGYVVALSQTMRSIDARYSELLDKRAQGLIWIALGNRRVTEMGYEAYKTIGYDGASAEAKQAGDDYRKAFTAFGEDADKVEALLPDSRAEIESIRKQVAEIDRVASSAVESGLKNENGKAQKLMSQVDPLIRKVSVGVNDLIKARTDQTRNDSNAMSDEVSRSSSMMLVASMGRPITEDDWRMLRSEVNEAFTPGAPIRTRTELAGRGTEIERLSDIVVRAGEHALVYGERGVGKTSLARTFHANLNRPTRRVQEIHVNCTAGDAFTAVWRKVFRRMATVTDGVTETVDKRYPNTIGPDDVEIELSNYLLNDLPIIILDEFDQIDNLETRVLIANTIKSLSDHTVHKKIALVGVSENASTLIAHHASLTRNLKQVKMPRLSLDELEGIITPRVKRCGMSIVDEALFQIVFLPSGLPYYSHLVGRNAALHAVENRRLFASEEDVLLGLASATRDVDQTITEYYLKAISRQRNEETLFESVLISCALAEQDDLGRFQQTSVAAPLSQIEQRQPPYTAATFAFHMNEFCEIKRGKVLDRSGEVRNYRYRFSDPMMQPYVIIRALQNGKLTKDTFDRFMIRRQGSLPIS